MRAEPSRIKEIFLAALEKAAPEDRSAFLGDACGGDAKLRQRIESMLDAHVRPDRLLDRPASEQLGAASDFALDFLKPSARPDSLGRLGHYEALEVVGRGAMGIVLRAFDEKLHRVVAIKALNPALASNGAARQRFVREARAAAAVTHDNVIAIHAVEDLGPIPYIVMQFIDGCTLQQKLDRNGPLPLKEILRLGIQTADGLAAAHRHGLVHRDVKPANILLENGIERVKITDFGLARAVDDASLTQSGVITGTPAYMSPEQADGAKVDHRSDLFSLGSVLYALCTGHPPFRAGTTMAILKRVCEETPRPIREVNPEIPEWLAALIAKLHAKEPGQRSSTAAEVAHSLSSNLARLQTGTAVTDPSSMMALASGPPAVREQRILSRGRLTGIGVLALAIVAAWLSRGWWLSLPARESVESARSQQTWRPKPPPTPDELALLRDPLDDWRREAIPPTLLSSVVGDANGALSELVAVIGDGPFRLPDRGHSHCPTESPDGRLIALPCGKWVVLYDTSNGAVIRILKGHTERTVIGGFSADGQRFACGANDGFVRVWDVSTGEEKLRFQDGTNHVWVTLISRDGTRIVTGGAEGAVKVWDAVDGRELLTLGRHEGGAAFMEFSPDGKRLATAGVDRAVRVWEWPSGDLLQTLEGHPDTIQSLAFSADSAQLASGSQSRVMVWDVATLQLRHSLETAGGGVVGFTPDGKTLVAAPHNFPPGQKRAITRWDLTTGTRTATIDVPGPLNPVVGCLSRDGRTVYMMSYEPPEARLSALSAVDGVERFPGAGHSEAVWSIAFSPSGDELATGGLDGRVCLWSLDAPTRGAFPASSRVLSEQDRRVWSVAFNLDGRLLASLGTDGARLSRVAPDEPAPQLASSPAPLHSSLAFSPDGETLAAGSSNGIVNLWAVKTGQPKEPLRWHVGPVHAVAFSPDGRWLASGGGDNIVQLVERQTGQRSHAFRVDTHVTSLVFSPNSQTLAATFDGSGPSVRLWNIATKAEQTLSGHTDSVVSLAFHPGGEHIATGSVDGTVRLWQLGSTAQQRQVFDFHHLGPSCGVAFSPSGRHLAAGLGNGLVAILHTPLPVDAR